jgi:hypothetical protein
MLISQIEGRALPHTRNDGHEGADPKAVPALDCFVGGGFDFRAITPLPCHLLRRRSGLSFLAMTGVGGLKGSRKGQYSVRINDQWRICFKWNNGNAFDIEIVDYH